MNRALIVGDARFGGVTTVPWLAPNSPNIADFDFIVVDETSLNGLLERAYPDRRIPANWLRATQAWLDRLRDRLRKVLKSQGTVVGIIGPGRTMYAEVGPDGAKRPIFMDTSRWMPIPVARQSERGQTIEVIDPRFGRYVSLLDRWEYHLGLPGESPVEEIEREHGQAHVDVCMREIARDRQKLPIAAEFHYEVHEGTRNSWAGLPSFESGFMVILPRPTKRSLDQGVRVVLEDLAEMDAPTSAPAFVANLRVPGEDSMDTRLGMLSAELTRVTSEIDDIEGQRRHRRRFLSLLYEKGVEGLQEVVRDAFEEMGISSADVHPEVSDEFTVRLGNEEMLVEVKGHRKGTQKEDIRQLDESLDQYEKQYGNPIKGALIVNAWCELPLEERDNLQRPSFPDNVVKRATAIDVILVSGVQLYKALCLFWEGRITTEAVWRKVYDASGVARFAE